MTDGQEPELTYYGYDDSFDSARSATKCFDETNFIPEATTAPVCACCTRQQRCPRFIAMMEFATAP
eukprot:6177249-Prorocentrum_lima.AAC.1